MTDNKSKNTNRSRRKKLKSFGNWLQCADLTWAMLIEKDVYDLIKNSLWQLSIAVWEQEQKIKKNQMAIGIAIEIIKEIVSNGIFHNIINITDFKEMWEML